MRESQETTKTKPSSDTLLSDSTQEAGPIRVAVGIPAYNEESNIDALIQNLLENIPESVKNIYVVSSGSTDKTNDIVTRYHETDPRIKLISQGERKGKAAALNALFDLAEAYDIMICLGADNISEEHSLQFLLGEFRDKNVGIVGGRPIPLNGTGSFSGWCAHMIWNLHHLVSLSRPKVSGELFAFRPGVIRELPPAIINDDIYIQHLYEMRGYSAVYTDAAKVRLMGPRKLKEFFRQRRRIFMGHRQAGFLLGLRIPTSPSVRNLLLVKKAMPSGGLKGYVYLLAFLIVTGTAWAASLWDFFRQNIPYKWEMAKSTKVLK